MWQVSVALNNLLARFQRMAQEDGFNRATTEQVAQARMALRQWQARREPVWPQAVGSPLDPLLADLRIVFGYLPAPSALRPSFGAAGPSGASAYPGGSGVSSVYGSAANMGVSSGPSQPLRAPYGLNDPNDPYATGALYPSPQPGQASGSRGSRMGSQPPQSPGGSPWNADDPWRGSGR